MTTPSSTPAPSASPTTSSLDFFPLAKARPLQAAVLKEIDTAFDSGSDVVLLEASVGSGKSAIAIALSKRIVSQGGECHIITPQKSLQDQYFEDFKSHNLVVMKGRNSYPCKAEYPQAMARKLIQLVEIGATPKPPFGGSCSDAVAVCTVSRDLYKECTTTVPCPYTRAMELAQSSPIIVHNLHSFIFQTSFAEKFEKRELLIIDEAHTVFSIVRDFCVKKVTVQAQFSRDLVQDQKSLKSWETELLNPKYLPELSPREEQELEFNPTYQTSRAKYIQQVLNISSEAEGVFKKGFSIEITENKSFGRSDWASTTLEFIPHNVGAQVRNYLLRFADKVLLMSGTIYSKKLYCEQMGLPEATTKFLRVDSTFPAMNRPILMKPEYMVNTSHAAWEDSLDELREVLLTIAGKFDNAKGLIHTPSYGASLAIEGLLKNTPIGPRLRLHTKHDFAHNLKAFFEEEGNPIFVSPTCQQGVDFKEGRARFQVILRIPYPSTGSAFMGDIVKDNYQLYNYLTLLTFGQQIGRINRSEVDYGATFLIDSRFPRFIAKNSSSIPKWVSKAMIVK